MAENFVKKLAGNNQRFQKKLLKYGSWLLGIWFVYSLLVGTFSLPRIIRLELEQRELRSANRYLIIELIDATRIHRMLKDNPSYIEYVARTKYRMVRPQETVYRFRGQ